MTTYLDLETAEDDLDLAVFDVVIVGAGAAGLTIARELGSQGVRTCVIESGDFEETPEHEALNGVEVDGVLLNPKIQSLREAWHSWQLQYWSADNQRFGVRTRVFGGSTSAWAGRAAPFDTLDFKARAWLPDSGWPVSKADLVPFIDRAAATMNLGPMTPDRSFWSATKRAVPKPVELLTHFDSFFWQFAKSSFELTRVKHFGRDFRRETFKSVTVLLNATAASLKLADGKAAGVSLLSSKTGRSFQVNAPIVVVTAGAIENARLLLLSGLGEPDATAPGERPAIGQYLVDHPTARLGLFDASNRDAAFRLLGFYGAPNNNRVNMYSHGLALRAEAQEEFGLPNMAAFAVPHLAADDPLSAMKRLGKRKSEHDLGVVLCNLGSIVTLAGRKALEHPKIPLAIRRRLIDLIVHANANFVALDYLSAGRNQKLDDLRVELIVEQPPERDNGIRLSETRDRLGLRKAEVHWNVSDKLRESILEAGNLLKADLQRAGFDNFKPSPAFASNKVEDLVTWDMGHTAGTTRMGDDPQTSVVDENCQVHGVEGLYVAGASTFPTIGHANPTLMIVAMAVRVADRLLSQVSASRAAAGSKAKVNDNASRPLVLVTGATGHLGQQVVNALCDKGYRVRAQYRKRPPDDGRVDWVRMDFADPDLAPEAFDNLVAGVDAVIHMAASLANVPQEMETTNVVNLERLAEACARNGVRYFGQASSMVVYGSPKVALVDEDTALLDLSRPLEKQFGADAHLLNYARSKRVGEDILRRYGDRMHVDLCRIAIAYPGILEDSLSWGRLRRLYSLARNTHFISPPTVGRAFVHLMERSLTTDAKGVEAYNICDGASPTFAEVYRRAGRSPRVRLPLVVDYLKSMKASKSLSLRRPQGAFRLDDRKLKATGFQDT